MKPVIPFEPISVVRPPGGSQWVAQVKWDGVRVLTYYDGDQVRLFNRRLNERTMQFPELINLKDYCTAASIILDGEVVALDQGKPSFHHVMKRDSVRQLDKVKRGIKDTPIVYMIFDLLYLNGEWVTGKNLEQRQQLLQDLIRVRDEVQLVENFADTETLFEVIRAQAMEGIVYKDINSTYLIKGKDKRWQKRKNYYDLIAVIGGVTHRNGIVNSLLLGLYDGKGQLWYIGHAGTAKFTDLEWRRLTEKVTPLIINNRPFINKPERIKGAIWIKPMLTVKVKFIEWTAGHTLRQPSIQALTEIPPEECLISEN